MWSRIWKMPTEVSPDGGNIVNHTIEMKLMLFFLRIAGALHCVVCTDQGEIYTWGDNDEGQLGDGTTTGIQKPRLVAALQVSS